MSPTAHNGAARTNYSVGRLLFVGFLFHLVFIGSVFDCYFTSPVVHGMKQLQLKQAEAKRLVLIVGTSQLLEFTPNSDREMGVAR